MADNPRARIDAKVLPSPPGEPSPDEGGGFLSQFKAAFGPAPDHNTPALAAIKALRECAGYLSSHSGAGRHFIWEDTLIQGQMEHGLSQLTRQGFETRPHALPLRYLLNVASFLDNMHLNYVQPTLMRLEEQRLLRSKPDESAARDVMIHGDKWLQTARESITDIRDALNGCYQSLGVRDVKALEENHPLRRIIVESELTYNRLLTTLEATNEPMQALRDYVAALPAPDKGR